MTPYNTGKVQIGLLYTPPPPNINDDHMIKLQVALCPPSRRIIAAKIETLRCAVNEALMIAGFAIFFVAIGYSPSIWQAMFN